jgi:hypothetical protein
MNKYQLFVKKFDQPKKRICANHPVSSWKEGYKHCYWGFKLKQVCKQLKQEGGEN